MKDESTLRWGSTASFLSALFLLTYLIGGALRPEAQNGSDISAYLLSLAEEPTMSLLLFWSGALYGVFAIAVVFATGNLVRVANPGLVRWASTLAIIGFAVAMMWYFVLQNLNPKLAIEFVKTDVATRRAVALIGPLSLDPQFMMSYGLTGLWFIIMNWLANKGNKLPKLLTYLGLFGGLASWLIVVGASLNSSGLETAGFILSSIVLAAWYIWTGIVLRRISAQGLAIS